MAGIPELPESVPIDQEQIDAYRRDGHVILRGLAAPETVAEFRPPLLEAGEKTLADRRPFEERDTYGQAFLQMFNLWRQNEAARAFVHSRRFARAAAELMGVEAVRLYHDQALFKEPGGGHTPWHQDQFYWPLATDRTITMWMPLIPVTPDMGLMTFATGSQRSGHLGDFAIGDESQQVFERLVTERGFARAETPALLPGDASFHSGWTLHAAPPNRTGTLREAMTIIFFADGTRVAPLDHPNRRLDRDTWLRGCEPGELAAGPINPVLYAAKEQDSG